MAICRLCGLDKVLKESHIIPAFAGRWLKETGATVYLRKAISPNKRVQDISKEHLLCEDCETLFSKHESRFAAEIFHPYVTQELDASGIGLGRIKEFAYDSWLLHFIISLQWRTITTTATDPRNNHHVIAFEATWRNFLLGKRQDTGNCESHIIFLQNLSNATSFPDIRLGVNVNTYILRSVDATTISSNKKNFGVYSKIGPIIFYTSIHPSKLKGATDSRIHMRGTVKRGQKIKNEYINRFILITRPNEIAAQPQISEEQNKKILDESQKNLQKTLNSMSFHAYQSDCSMRKKGFIE